MKIGDLELELIKPERLDRQLIAATGCSAAEIRGHLVHAAIASHVARALIPFVKDAPAPMVLADAIAKEGVIDVRAAVLALYDAELGIEPPPMPEHLQAAISAPAKGGRRGKKAA